MDVHTHSGCTINTQTHTDAHTYVPRQVAVVHEVLVNLDRV